MAIAEVGSGSQRATGSSSGGGTADVVYPGNVTSGNFGIVCGGIWNTPNGPTVITTSKSAGTATIGSVTTVLGSTGITWSGGVGIPFISYFPITGTGSLTMNVQTELSSDWMNIACDEFSGVHATPLDVDGGEFTFVGTTTPTDSITTLTANDLIVGVMLLGGSETITVGSGYTQIAEDESSAIQAYNAQFRIVTSATSYNVEWTLSIGNGGTIYNAAFKEAVAPPADTLIGAFMMA